MCRAHRKLDQGTIHFHHHQVVRVLQVVAETIPLCQPMVAHVQVDHVPQVLALQFVQDNKEHAQVLVSAPVRYQAVVHFHLVMLAEPVDQAAVIPAAELVAQAEPVALAEAEAVRQVVVVRVDQVDRVDQAAGVKLVAHSVEVAPRVARLANRSLGRLVGKRSITYAHQLLVAQ